MALSSLKATRLISAFMKEAAKPPVYMADMNEIARRVKADSREEAKFPVYSSLAPASELAGAKIFQTVTVADITENCPTQPWQNGVKFSDDDVRSDSKFNELIKKAAALPKTLDLALYNRFVQMLMEGDANTYGTCVDGQEFFDTTHGWGGAGTMANLITATEAPKLQVTATTSITEIEAEAIIPSVLGFIQTEILDDKGNYMYPTMQGVSMRIDCPPNIEGGFDAAIDPKKGSDSKIGLLHDKKIKLYTHAALEDAIFYLTLFPSWDTDEKPMMEIEWPSAKYARRFDYKLSIAGGHEDLFEDMQYFDIQSWIKQKYAAWWRCFRCVLST